MRRNEIFIVIDAKMAADGWSLVVTAAILLVRVPVSASSQTPGVASSPFSHKSELRALQFFVTGFPPYSPSISLQREFDVDFAVGIRRVATDYI